jgi:hypothetical protein
MSTTTDYTDPSKRCLATEVKELDTQTLLTRKEEIGVYMKTGVVAKWMIIKNESTALGIEFWGSYDFARYLLLINMELFDRCNSFELLPKLKFNF